MSIEIRNVSKQFGDFHALRDVSLDIHSGELIALLGPSGCGKTTLLRLIAGLEDVSGGRILIDGQDVTRLAPAKRGLSMVFQSYALYPHMSVRRNIAFGLQMARLPADEIERRVSQAAQILNLGDYLDRRPG